MIRTIKKRFGSNSRKKRGWKAINYKILEVVIIEKGKRSFIVILITFVLFIFGATLLFKYRDIIYIENQIAANGWDAHIISEQTRYDSKIGEFYKVVTFEEYEEYEEYIYDYRVRETFDSKEKYIITLISLDNTGLDDLHMPYQFAMK
ncbi:MAG: hypothetical protein JJU16_00400 [Alkalibacterium sp.]|nr:hypothetical protein [Alkalibacterium sp.]